jgi:hypothetical protein
MLLVLGSVGFVSGGWRHFLKNFGYLPLINSLAGWCALYALFKFKTN